MATQNKGYGKNAGFRLLLDWDTWSERAFGGFAAGNPGLGDQRATASVPPTDMAGSEAQPAAQPASQSAPAAPEIRTDLDDYAPGSTAYVTIDGVETGATVRFEIDHVSDPGADGQWGTLDDVTYQRGGEGHDPWFVVDGGDGDLDGEANGSIQTSWYVNPDDSLDERFLLTGHVVDTGADGLAGTADDRDTGVVASNTFTDSGGDYSIDFSVGDPGSYNKKRPSEFTVFPVGRANEPIPGASDLSAKEALSPKELALGQIVPFEVEISTRNSATFTGTMEFVVAWSTKTSNGTDFGYDENFGLVAAFVDGLDAGTTDTDSTVSQFSWVYDAAAGEFVGTIRVTNLDPDSRSVVELWVVLDQTIAPGTNGNVPARLVSAVEIGTDQKITTGAQTVPLLKVAEFFTGTTDLAIVVSDEPGDTAPSAGGDPDPVLRAGDQFTYTIFASNRSVETVANGVIVTDVLDANVDFVSVTVNGTVLSGVYDSATHRVTIDLGFLERADGAVDFDSNTATILLTVQVKDGVAPGTSLTNTASITSVTSEGASADNTNTETTVLAVNGAPVALADTNSLAEDGTLSVPAGAGVLANDSDPDGQSLSVTQFTVGGVTRLAGQTATIAAGSLTIQADGSYSFVPAANFNGSVPVASYTVTDPFGGTATSTLSLTVTPANDAPVAVDDAASTDEDRAVTLAVLGNDSDLDGDALTVTGVSGATGGTAVINADGTITFTPTANFHGVGGFSYTISDGQGGTDTASVAVTVAPVNDAPVAVDDAASTDEDRAVTVAVLGNDSDLDGDTLTVTGVSGATGGTAVVNADGTITFTPTANFHGVGGFSYTISDGQGGTDTASVAVTVAPVNDAPVAVDDAAATDEDRAVTVAVLGNDSDLDGDTLTVTGVSGATGGTAVINADGTITFTPTANFHGIGGFSYTISDGQGGTDTASVAVTVAPVNDAPVAVDDAASTDEDRAVTVAVLGNDSDLDGDTLTVTGVSGATGGTAVINADGTITFTPSANFHGIGGFSYTISDGQGGTDTASVAVTVAPVNDAPVAVDDAASSDADGTVEIVVTLNDTDPDGDDLAILSVDTSTILGTVTIVDGDRLRYDPNGAFDALGQGDTAVETFTYTVSDGNGGTSTATVTVTVGGINDAPVAVDDVASTKQGRSLTIDVLANDGDVNGDGLAISANTDPANGTLTLNADGTFTYVPVSTFFGTDSFGYTISDGRGGTDTATATITVERNLTPRIPEPVVFFAPENQLVGARLQAIDPEGDAVTYSIVGGVDAALFTIDAQTGVMSFKSAPDFEAPTDANLDNRYVVRVGLQDAFNSTSQNVTVNVTDVADTPNRAPVISTNSGADMRLPLLVNRQGMILDIDALDLDGDTLVFRLFGEDASKFTIDAVTGELTLPTPLTNPRGSLDGDFVYELDVLVEDGNGGTATIGIDYVLFTAG